MAFTETQSKWEKEGGRVGGEDQKIGCLPFKRPKQSLIREDQEELFL